MSTASLAAVCDYPLHLGLTEAGMGSKGIVATTAALAPLLLEGIGDTIRTSLTPMPNGDRTEEVIVSQQILQSLGIRSFTPQVTACPGCGRTTSTFFQEMADQIQTYLREPDAGVEGRAPRGRDHEGGGDGLHRQRAGRIQTLQHRHLASRHRSKSRRPPSSSTGGWLMTLKGDRIVAEFIAILDEYVESHYAAGVARSRPSLLYIGNVLYVIVKSNTTIHRTNLEACLSITGKRDSDMSSANAKVRTSRRPRKWRAGCSPAGFKIFNRVVDWITSDRMQLINVTDRINEIVRKSGIRDGIVHLQSLHTTTAVFINEWQDALLHDVRPFWTTW